MCKVCGAEYATEEGKQEHLWADHVDVLWQNKLWTCEYCTYQTHRGDDVERQDAEVACMPQMQLDVWDWEGTQRTPGPEPPEPP